MQKQIEKFKRIAGEYWDSLNPLIFLGPIGVTLLIALLLVIDKENNNYWYMAKNAMETVSLILLIPALLIAFIRFCIHRTFFFLWLTGFIFIVVLREIHWEWTSDCVYALLFLQIILAYLFYDNFKPYISSAACVNLITAAFFCYFISEMLLDHNWAQMPSIHWQGVSLRNALEECVEALGHFVLTASVFLISPADSHSPDT